jgi:hypothetical protein
LEVLKSTEALQFDVSIGDTKDKDQVMILGAKMNQAIEKVNDKVDESKSDVKLH